MRTSSTAWTVVGVPTGTRSPSRGPLPIVRNVRGVAASATTRVTGPISWIRLAM